MAAKSKEEKAKEKKDESVDQIDNLLDSKEAKGMHLGSRSGEEIIAPDIITTGSLAFDDVLGGGYRSSSWARFYAEPESGKTSMALCWGKNWQDFYGDDAFVAVLNAEGRVSTDLIQRSGIDTSKERFRIIDTNVSDFIWHFIDQLIKNNPLKKKYFFIVDSTDACIRVGDMEKSCGDAEKIGGSATILSAAGKKLSLLFSNTGHFLFMASQVRDKVNTYSPTGNAGKDASGGNAPRFYSSLTGEIKKPWSDTYIYEDPSDKKSKIIGRLVEIKLVKTYNETSGTIVVYPVKYGSGIWSEYEAMLQARTWEFVEKKGAHYSFSEAFMAELDAAGIKYESKFHGEKNLRSEFDSNKELSQFVLQKVRKAIL